MTRRLLTRVLAAAGAASGAVLAARPQQVVDRLAPEFPHSKVWIVRLLGARLLVQHGAVTAPVGTAVRAAGAGAAAFGTATGVPRPLTAVTMSVPCGTVPPWTHPSPDRSSSA